MNVEFWVFFASILFLYPGHGRADDRLWSDPGILRAGATLPGDAGPIPMDAPGQARDLSLLNAVNLALNHNPLLKETWARIKIRSAAVGKADAALWPSLSANLSRVGDRLDYPGYPIHPNWMETYQVSATADWQVFSFGSGWFRQDAAERLLESAVDDQNAALQEALDTVIQDYYDAYSDHEAVLSDGRDVELARQTVVCVLRREKRGIGTRGDSLQAKVSLLKLVLRANRDQGAYAKACALLVYDLGVPPDTEIGFPDGLNPDLRYTGTDLRSWMAQARENHPAIRAARAKLRAARDGVAVSVSDTLPSVDLQVDYYRNGRPDLQLSSVGSDEVMVLGTVSVPLFSGFSGLYAVRSARARVEEQRAILDDERNSVLRGVVKAYRDTESAFKNLQASQDLLQAAEEAFRASRNRFTKGVADIMELLEAQAALADARRQRVRCLAEWRSARLRLVASAGSLNSEELAH